MKQLFIGILIVLFGLGSLYAQSEYGEPTLVRTAVYFDETPPLRDMPIVMPGERDRSWKDNIIENKSFKEEIREKYRNSPYNGPDEALQTVYQSNRGIMGPLQNFDGVGNVNGVYPPDTDGDVGPDHYFQMINLSYAIWDKQGNKLYGPVDNSTLWNGFIGPWTGTNDGDPIVFYDEIADRWVATQFAINTSNGTYWELFAVSQTPDPLGAYYRYAFQFLAFNDYPKVSAWSDAYYATFNMFGSYTRVGVAAFERDEMLAGNPNARMVYYDLSGNTFGMLPSDVDGPAPPAGSPAYFAHLNVSNQLEIWEFDVDWTNTSNSSFSLAVTLTPATYSSNLNGVPQPNTSQRLDDLGFFLMNRLQYRNFGSYQTLVTNHTVNSGGTAGIRWYELRKDNADWYIYQQGTYSPVGIDHRWMGSIAMNGNGDIALGYSISSGDRFPSIMYTGRRADDPLGQMTVEEVELVTGLSSQTFISRWGDYSCMSVDPADDSTFWYTQEYMKSNGWGTRISSFNLGPLVPPTADAGEDTVICENTVYPANAVVTSTASVEWTTSGDGFFQDPQSQNTFYLRGNQDITNGGVTLYINAFGYLPGSEATDSVFVTINQLPFALAGEDTLLCTGESLFLENAIAVNYDTLTWTSSGDGTFDDPNILNATYTPGPQDISSGQVILILTASGIDPCEDNSVDQIEVTIDECTGLPENSMDERLSLSLIPNPNNGEFDLNVEGKQLKNLVMRIYNLQGQEVFIFRLGDLDGVYKNRINMTNFPEGIYFLNIQNGEINRTEKVVVN